MFFLTVTTDGRRPWFRDPSVSRHCITELREACAADGFHLLAFCFMPDHLHLLIAADADGLDVIKLIHDYKQRTGWWFRNRRVAGGLKASPTATSSRLWQKSYHDHVLRREEDLSEVVAYILENPLRGGLCNSVDVYPYSWSESGID